MAIIAEPPISSRPCQAEYSLSPTSGTLLSQAKSGSVTFPLLMSLISGTLLSTRLLTSRAIGITNSRNSNRVIASTASSRLPNSTRCRRSSTGQVAITTVPAQAKDRINGCTTHRQDMIIRARNSTDSSICGMSRG